MTWRATVRLALGALLRNRMRSLLTMLGVVIGVAAVLVMQSLGQGATAYVGETISGLGANMLIASPGAQQHMGMALGVPLFTLRDVETIRRQARDVERVAALNTRQLRAVAGANNRSTMVSGTTPEYLQIREWGVVRGRLLTADDERQAAQVCLIGHTVATSLFPGAEPIGHELRLHGVSCRVVGELEAKGASAFGQDQDDLVLLPFSTFARRIVGNERVAILFASAVDAERIDDAKEQITTILRHRRHILPGEDDDFGVRDPREIQAVLQKITGMLTAVLLGVAAISLLVGGIGIMNIMLVSVTERTREIGIRLAVGARGSDVLLQFLVEAVVLSALGGAIGVALGTATAVGLARALHVPSCCRSWRSRSPRASRCSSA